MAYELEGRMLEVCSCKVICPCWVGENPDGDECDGTIAWRIDRGQVNGVDVSGLTLGVVAHIPGNALEGKWRAQVFVDDRATPEQEDAILSAFTGQEGGPLADLAQLIGEVVSVERVPIIAEVEKGSGRLRIGDVVSADMEAYEGATERTTTLHDTALSFIPGAPAYVGKAAHYRMSAPGLGRNVEFSGHSSVQSQFRFQV